MSGRRGVYLTAHELAELRANVESALDAVAADSGALRPLGNVLQIVGMAERAAQRAGIVAIERARLRGRARLTPVTEW